MKDHCYYKLGVHENIFNAHLQCVIFPRASVGDMVISVSEFLLNNLSSILVHTAL